MSKIVSKENIIKAFDKASGFGVEFGDFADYHEIQPIRDEFVRIIDQLFKIEMRQITSIISDKSLAMITEDLKNIIHNAAFADAKERMAVAACVKTQSVH